MKKRTGKNPLNSIFTPTGTAATSQAKPQTAAESEPRKPGRPPVHDEEWKKVTVVLLERQIVFLDRLALDIRRNTGAAIRRAEIIRALVDALEQSGTDLTSAKSEEELRNLITGRLG